MNYTNGWLRGALDDTTFGASNLALGKFKPNSQAALDGYSGGTGFSLGASFFYGAGFLKCGKMFNVANTVFESAKITKNVLGTRNFVKLTQEAKPVVRKVMKASRNAEVFFVKNGAKGSSNLVRLNKQLASIEQLGEKGKIIAGPNSKYPFRNANKYSKCYGGNSSEWVKKSSSFYKSSDGRKFETHWIENIKTEQRYEFKTKFDIL